MSNDIRVARLKVADKEELAGACADMCHSMEICESMDACIHCALNNSASIMTAINEYNEKSLAKAGIGGTAVPHGPDTFAETAGKECTKILEEDKAECDAADAADAIAQKLCGTKRSRGDVPNQANTPKTEAQCILEHNIAEFKKASKLRAEGKLYWWRFTSGNNTSWELSCKVLPSWEELDKTCLLVKPVITDKPAEIPGDNVWAPGRDRVDTGACTPGPCAADDESQILKYNTGSMRKALVCIQNSEHYWWRLDEETVWHRSRNIVPPWEDVEKKRIHVLTGKEELESREAGPYKLKEGERRNADDALKVFCESVDCIGAVCATCPIVTVQSALDWLNRHYKAQGNDE